ncbi:MAG: hypothetical protein AB7U98_00410 [Candidatus Nitrosocosmicus sp.]
MNINNNISNFDFKDLFNLPIYASDNVNLGKINSIDKNHLLVKFDENDRLEYRFPLDLVDKWDGHSLWLRITSNESNRYICNSALQRDQDADNKADNETVTFRLNENVMKTIRTGATNREISLNSFANYILDKYIKQYKFEDNWGIAYINKPALIEIFSNMSKDEVINLAKHIGKNAINNRVLFTYGNASVDSVVKWTSDEMSRHSFSFKHIKEIDKDVYTIWHGIGHNFSLYYKTILEELLDACLNKPVRFTLTDEILVFEIACK